MTRLNRFFLNGFMTVTLLIALPSFSHAIGFTIDWTGSSGYIMTGMFSYSDALTNTGAIDETQIDTLIIDVLLNGVSQGTWNLADGLGAGAVAFNFNFDTSTETFVIGGSSIGTSGQLWNFLAHSGVGFISGSGLAGVTVNGDDKGLTRNFQDLTATRKPITAVPEPSTFLLFGTGMLGLLGYTAHRKRQANAAT